MELLQTTTSALLASNVSTIVSSKNKSKTPVPKFNTNINHRSYNQQLVWNRYALHTAGRYAHSEQCVGIAVSAERNFWGQYGFQK